MIRRGKDTWQEPLHLPPRELWYFTPGQDERLPTPLNDMGLVDAKELIELVKTTVDPSCDWELSERADRHHLYWRHSNYPYLPDEDVDPHAFCELPSNKILIPRMFHSWLHLVTEEPPVPSDETMHHSIEAQRTAAALFASARQSKRLVRANKNSNRRMESALERHLSKFHDRLEEARAVPEEFQLVNFADYQVDTIDDAYTLTAKLGAFAARGTLTRVRDVLREVAV